MIKFSTRQAAARLGIHPDTLAQYVSVGKVPSPSVVRVGTGKRTVHAWSNEDIEQVRKLLPKIKNGRKTRYQKKATGNRSQGTAKAKTKKK